MAQSFLNRADLPIGLRHNNVGNLKGNDMWQGKIGMNGSYPVFENVAWGIRAFVINLYSQINKNGYDTPLKYISVYAPLGDWKNNPTAYATKLANDIGIGVNDKIPLDGTTLRKIIRSQMEMELGKKYADMVTNEDVEQGIALVNDKVKSFFNASVIFAKNNKGYVALGGGLILLSIAAIFYLKGKK